MGQALIVLNYESGIGEFQVYSPNRPWENTLWTADRGLAFSHARRLQQHYHGTIENRVPAYWR